MILLAGFYNDPSPVRTEEFLECLRRNAANHHIDQITVFLEDGISRSQAQAQFPALTHPKLQLVEYGRRLTYANLFDYANRNLAGAPIIVANADIFFDETLGLLDSEPLDGRMLCLSRWDEGLDGGSHHFDRPDSQDAWIFEPPLPRLACDFCLGKPGCDNRLAYEVDRAGLTVSNPSRSVRARHLHHSAVRRSTDKDRIVGPIRLVPASFLKANGPWGDPSILDFPSHRGVRVQRVVDSRCREIETLLAPLLGGIIPRGLRRELRLAVRVRTVDLPRPDAVPLAGIAFRESMGYTVAQLAPGISTHNNDERPLVFIPDALAGQPFTQVVANHSTPIEIEFHTTGRLFALAAPGWDGYAAAAAFLDEAGWREPIDPLRTRDGTVFEPWSLVANAGERLVLPTQVMLIAADLVRLR